MALEKQIITGPYGAHLIQIFPQGYERDPKAILENHHADATRIAEATHQLHCEYGQGILYHGRDPLIVTDTFNAKLVADTPTLLRAVLLQQQSIAQAAFKACGLSKAQIVNALSTLGDCYTPDPRRSMVEVRDFQHPQVYEGHKLGNLLLFETINSIPEAMGIALAAKERGAACIISFVVGKDGKLLSGENLGEAIQTVDSITGKYPLGYGLNCSPIEGLEPALQSAEFSSTKSSGNRIVILYPNGSSLPPKILETMAQNGQKVSGLVQPWKTAQYIAYLAKKYDIQIVGGCCGFSPPDVAMIANAVHQDLYSEICPHLYGLNGENKL